MVITLGAWARLDGAAGPPVETGHRFGVEQVEIKPLRAPRQSDIPPPEILLCTVQLPVQPLQQYCAASIQLAWRAWADAIWLWVCACVPFLDAVVFYRKRRD